MSIQTTTPTSPTFILNRCNSTNYNSIISSTTSLSSESIVNNNCVVTTTSHHHQMNNPYSNYLPSSSIIDGGRNVIEEQNNISSSNVNVNTSQIPSSSSSSSNSNSIIKNNNSVFQNNSQIQSTTSPSTVGSGVEPSSSTATTSSSKLPSNEIEQSAICAVCGETGAKPHYNVFSCLGCKGFFRRALKKVDQYECINDNKCVINKDGRNSCRACRLRKCLEAGMDPSAVRPDRDFINKSSFLPQITKIKKPPEPKKQSPSKSTNSNVDKSARAHLSSNPDDWTKKLPVEMRTMLMNLLNMEIKITRGDTLKEPSEIYPLHITIREVIENPTKIKGKRTEMRYEPYRMAKNEELCLIVYRRVLAAIDWVEYLSEMVEGLSTDDRIALVKSSFAPLLLFKCSARTAMVTDMEDILCLSNFAYVPRDIAKAYTDTYHLDNNLVERLINELVKPFRRLKITEEEVVCLSAIIVLNPMAKDLSEAGMQKVSALRDKIQDTLFQYIKESRTNGQATCNFGNFLLYLPLIASLSNVLCENIRFAQTFSTLGSFPLLTSVFGCFPVEPLLEADGNGLSLRKNVEVQTEPLNPPSGRGVKRRLPSYFVSPVENEMSDEHNEFRLLRPPGSYTLTEMFEDRMNDDNSQQAFQIDPQMTWPPRMQQGPNSSRDRNPNSSKHYPLQSSGSSKQIILSKQSSLCSSINSNTSPHIPHTRPRHNQQHASQQAHHRQQQQQHQPINFMSLGNNYNQNPTFPPQQFNLNQVPYPTTYVPPPIENLTFEHRENSNR